MSQTFTNDDAKGINFTGKDLSNCVFQQCNLSSTVFESCDLTGVIFDRCFTEENAFTSFSKANCTESMWRGCRLTESNFNDTNLAGARFRNTDISGSSCRDSHWDDSRLDDVDFSLVDFDLASFRNVKVLRVKFKPALVTSTRHFLRLLKQKQTAKHTIFTSGTELSPFIEYCSREYRLSLLLLEIEQLPFLSKIPRVLFAAIIGLVSDFGHSLKRWAISSLLMVSVFAGYFAQFKSQVFSGYSDAWHHSLLHFINQGNFQAATNGPVQTSLNVLGYFMLGILISIITNRFVSRW
ncbi:pentapeptide repeat-containing protein [Psychrosphaera haliotis]|uniref:Pentapeptide repeat-containing protein n=1 Tax=Psychrosphaera haliotis TaxID=555083 RepID=A0A6N8F766_9GAMM|nr:pentapeptide repeat-containing protein [Psychrosphaera haliotis]MUH72078.1 hypothetical protein [Psychrosphaera haliotis]